jgi:outer membrane protein TolC
MRARSRVLVFLLAAWAAGSGSLFPESRSLQDCLEPGMRNSKALRAAELRLQALEAAYLEARDTRLPSLILGAHYARLSPLAASSIDLGGSTGTISLFPAIEDTFALSASLQQPLRSGLRIRSSIAQAKAGEALKVIREILLEVSQARIDLEIARAALARALGE